MWVKKISLENIKGFREQELSFTRNKRGDKPYYWITLLGENGVGKTTFLQAMALLLAGPEAAKELLSDTIGWVRDSSKPGKLKAVLYQEDVDAGTLRNNNGNKVLSPTYSYFLTGNNRLKIGKETYPPRTLIEEESEILSQLRTNAFASTTQGWFAVGYGAFRRLSREDIRRIPRLDQPKRSSNFATQFNDNRPLSSFEEWMIHLDYRIAKDVNDTKARQMRTVGEAAIIKLIPGNVRISEITTDGLIMFSVDEQQVPTISLSDGFRSIIALAGDLIWRLLQAFPNLDDPTQASGVVLIDELDIHLHPSWQRYIAGWLREVFPNLQFFVATHSPLVAAGAGEDALTLRFDMINGEVEVTPVKDISAYDADYILRSPAFGLTSTYSPATQEKIERYNELTRKINDLIGEERKEYETLRKFMKEAQPIGGPPEPGSLEARTQAFLEAHLP
ncbi:AAA family ATPase [Ancylothrix sp. C2]|uniref:AAA family ATPase n=1 Tax=Ancylothrix sp. D3o TaxID=2953691 RepID=UPI0021BA75D2|nr:AAA family ATPase [Ancylothrix sp. D3o]MCT7951325.1 AAA family ATPase [Ancylothrix sp. D3o]